MTFDQFTTKYNGTFVDYDKVFGAQCTDLMRQYIKEVLGLEPYKEIPAAQYAKYMFSNFPNSGTSSFAKIFNGPTNSPKKGDIVFWGTYPFVTGIAGHVALCSAADAWNLITFDQNYGYPKTCRFIKHSYKGVLGWLSPKK